jgi:predicted dithiol-disulfide oxidoreductase (DUF899 family)
VKITYPGESDEYRLARNRLLEQEIALRRMMEAVAESRRALPPGGVVPEDYEFDGANADGVPVKVRMSELFAPGRDTLLLYSFMFPRHPEDDRPEAADGETAKLPRVEQPCPSCTALLDQLDGAARHLEPLVGFAAVANAPIGRVLQFGRERGWRHLRLLSSQHNDYKRDYLSIGDDGSQQPMMNVFRRDGGVIRHFWGSELLFATTDADEDPRHLGTIEPLWTMLDLTPEGRRTDWDEQLDYS